MNNRKIKELKQRVPHIQLGWLRSVVPDPSEVTMAKLPQLLPEETHVKAIGSVRLSYMSDRWVLKMLKRYPEVKTFAQLNKKINGS